MKNLYRCFRDHPPKSIDLEKWQTTVDLISELFGTACGAVVQIRDDEFNVVKTSSNESNFLSENQNWSWDIKSFCRKVVESKEALYVSSARASRYWEDAPAVDQGPVRSYLGVPIFWPDGTVFGTICSIDTKETDYSSSLQQLMVQLRDLISADLKHIVDYRRLEMTAITDELTQLYNLRGVTTLGKQRIHDAHRFNFDVGLVYFDIDNLKLVNDSLGHGEGDRCIIGLSEVLSSNFRKSDIVARIGGDEFLVIILCEPGSKNEVADCCLRIEQVFAKQFASFYQDYDLSISYGKAFFQGKGEVELPEMIAEVDRLMYERKREKKLKQSQEALSE